MENEIWKPVKGYWKYAVSNFGRVRSSVRGYDKILKPFKDSNGYYRVKLYKNKIGKQFSVHQLVAVAFLGHEINGYKMIVDHIDGNPSNNNVSNLQIITQLENHERGKAPRKSKYRGVYHAPKANSPKKWRAEFYIKGKKFHAGCFETEYEAHIAYTEARKGAIKSFDEIVNG